MGYLPGFSWWEIRQKKRALTNVLFANALLSLARPGGFEPPTPGSEVQCSIQLSYERLFNGIIENRFLHCKPCLTKQQIIGITDYRHDNL